MNIKNQHFIKIFFAIVITTMALLFLIRYKTKNNYNLVLYNVKTDTIIKKFAINKNDTFSIEFIHSVNKTPVKDYYFFDDNLHIYIYKTSYYSFGAGVQTELNDSETITYGKNGEMIINNINKKVDELMYFVGTVSDHILQINDREKISLRDLCNKNTLIKIFID